MHGGNADHPVAIIDDVVFTPVIPPAVRVLTPPLTSLAKGQPIEWWAERDPLHGFYVSLSSPTRQSFDSYVASPDLTGARVIHSGLGVYLYFVRPTARRIDLVTRWLDDLRRLVPPDRSSR